MLLLSNKGPLSTLHSFAIFRERETGSLAPRGDGKLFCVKTNQEKYDAKEGKKYQK